MPSEDCSFVNSFIPAYWSSSLVGEDLPMTMQVAMVGTDGIVLASDTKWAIAQRRGNLESRHTSLSTKITVNDQCTVAISCAKHMETASAIADAIIKELSDKDWECPIGPMQTIGQRVLDTLQGRNLFHCLV